MKPMTRRMQCVLTGLMLLALVALWPPDPYIPAARAQSQPPLTPQIVLPLMLGAGGFGAPAPDLRFTPDTISLAPGAEASIAVHVEPAADMRGATFELPGAQDGVISSFQAAADGMSGTLLITASTALEVGDRALDVQGRSGVSIGTWVGKLALKTTGTANAVTRFVDAANGSDQNPGLLSKPFKTLKKALSVSKAGDTINLAPGSYTKNGSGDTYPQTVPAGVTIVGTLASNGAQRTFLSPVASNSGEIGLIFAGDATVKNLEMDVFTTAMQANAGKISLSNLNLVLNFFGLELRGSSQTTLSKSKLLIDVAEDVHGVFIGGKATFTMDGGQIEGANNACTVDAAAIRAFDTAQVSLKNNPQFRELPGHVLHLEEASKATVSFAAATKTYQPQSGCKPAPLFEAVDAAQLTINDSTLVGQGSGPGVAVVGDSSAPLTISRTSIGGFNGAGIVLGSNAASAKVEQSGIAAGGTGIDAEKALNATLLVTDTRIDRNISGLIGLKVKMRRSKVTNGTQGVTIIGNGADLGSLADLGLNTFTGNTVFGVQLQERSAAASITLAAIGNTWNANTQGADGLGRYVIGSEISTLVLDIVGKNVSLAKKDTQTALKVVL